MPAGCIDIGFECFHRMLDHLDAEQARQADGELLLAVDCSGMDLLAERKREGLMKSLVFLTGFGHDERTP